MNSCDIAVIGAGAAGLSATRTLIECGLSAICVEARERAGGRAWTDSETFGVPFDRGCAWLHSGDINPWQPIAAELGFTVIEQRQVWQSRVGSRWLGEDEEANWDRVVAARLAAIVAVGASGRDISASAVAADGGAWGPLAEAVVTWYTSMDSDQVSTRDIFNANDTNVDWPIVEGYGALVARYGEGLPVWLATPAARIAWGDHAVVVDTPKGAVQARAAVIAVPTDVLASGEIRFDPPLPVAKQEAIHNIPLGNAEKIVFRIEGDPFGMRPGSFGIARADVPYTGGYQFYPFERPLVIGFLGGSCARELAAAGEDAMVDFGISELVHMFGAGVRRHIGKSAVTDWASDPFIRGGYSAARPGHAHRRADLAAALDGKLFFAGEACSIDAYATCHGAYLTGVAAAKAAAAALQVGAASS
jgi:monoamine oxidase